MDAKAKVVSSATEFMARVGGKSELYEVEGLTVRIRSLGYDEAQSLHESGTTGLSMAFQALVLGLEEPKLDEEQVIALHRGKPGPLMAISRRIMEISGMVEGDGPLAGDGSSA